MAAIDEGFVRARPERVFDVLRDPSGYPTWWPGVRAGTEGRLVFPEIGSVSTQPDGIREGVEVVVRVSGPGVRGHLQWYLEPFKEGTIVYGITDLQTERTWRPRRVLRHRASIHAALFTLKETLE